VLTGWPQAEVLGRMLPEIFNIIDERTRGPVEDPALRALREGAITELAHQTILIARDGTERPIDDSAAPIRDDAGTQVGAVLIFRDVTERKRAEQALARNALLLAGVRDSVVVTDLKGIVTYWNEGATKLFGWTAAEMLGRHYADRFPEPTRAYIIREIRARAAGAEWSGEYEDYRKDGSRVWIDARVGPVTDAAGRVTGVLGLAHDITDRKRAEQALLEADRRKDEFLALLAHELRNPLAPLRNGLQVMRLAAGDANAISEVRRMMDRQLSHMVRLIDDLLDVSRISRNKMELRRTRVLLADVIRSAVETARPLLDSAGHDFTVSLPPEPIYLDADLTRLAQVVGNLLTNSAKYTPQGGRIWLEVMAREERRRSSKDEPSDGAPPSPFVTIQVRDTGIGIPPESLPTLFDMFSQVDRSIERSTGGLGIGLALVKGLVEMHGGVVKAESPGPGKGSTFTIQLPILESAAEFAADVTTEDGSVATGPGRRILVVDDNHDSALSMAMMLRLMGDEVKTAHDGLEAVKTAETFRPQIVLMDVGMPRLNGYEATRRIHAQAWGKAIAVIALTGWGQEGDKQRSLEAGCVGHLVKPVSLADLEKLLAELTEA
jgi:PAS domain S-box-containing protein